MNLPGGLVGAREKGESFKMQLVNDLLIRALSFQAPKIDLPDEKGQTLAEYGLIMAVIAVAVVVTAVTLFRGAIIAAFNSATNCLDGTC